ncbi:MAG TPA: DNA-3-methyladenine glycosylase 2 family protein [Candidatus Eisenbacteria bacterium]|nr:DNA-3-methyladenine glycosylase 2 family protein [Candidatus Eisenbacteria bacterium]
MALPYDLEAAIRAIRESDPRLARVIDAHGACMLVSNGAGTPFAALARSIVYQQLAGKAAAAIHGRVLGIYKPRRILRPEDVLATTDERLREAGLSRAKTLALKDLAQKTVDGVVPSWTALRRLDDEEIITRITTVRGVGRWTVEMLLIFHLGRPDVLPVSDYGVRKGFQRTFRKRALPTPKELTKHGERWRPYRSVASWYLWRALEERSELPT